ncbi:unnamed protein product [Ranitomeya imitator]|uniref:Uncharacterized protein n=1 Tax=Ranitomeya imitator TaxID=111125 RepID=A0ABN9LV28_9NEOB|nr:unnamed protein product [Ranitomeya imitator]
MYERLVPNEERFPHASPSGSPPDACDYINNQTSDSPGAGENLSASHPASKKEDSDVFDSSSDLTVSITESDDLSAEDLLDVIDGKKIQEVNELEAKPLASDKKTCNTSLISSPERDSYEDSSSISSISQ